MKSFFKKNPALAVITLAGFSLGFGMVSSAPVVHAAPIYGTVNFGSPVANIQIGSMNTGTFIGAPSFTVVTPATGDFASSLGSGGTASNILGNIPMPGFLTFNGFTVDVTGFIGPNVWTLTSLPGGVDFLSAAFTGIVKKTGFDDTLVTGAISAQYAGGYNSGTVVAWSGNMTSQVPEPMSFALMGAGLIGIAALRRRHAA